MTMNRKIMTLVTVELLDSEHMDMIDTICKSAWYKRVCSELHEKYPPVDDDYPEEYWTEFNARHRLMFGDLFLVYAPNHQNQTN